MRRVLWVFDLAAVFLFVGIGLSVHTHGLSLTEGTSTAWPFVSGLAVGWFVLGIWKMSPKSTTSGVTVSLLTVVVGMTLRLVSGQGIAFAFVLVALSFLGATMVGWRLLVAGLERLRQSPVL